MLWRKSLPQFPGRCVVRFEGVFSENICDKFRGRYWCHRKGRDEVRGSRFVSNVGNHC